MKRWGADENARVWLWVLFQTLALRIWMTPARSCFIHSHSIRIQFHSSDWVSGQVGVLHLLALTCREVIHSSSAAEERVNSFVSWNVIQVIVSATELPQVSRKRLLNTQQGNNVARSNCWAKGNCEIFRSEKKHDYLCWLEYVDIRMACVSLKTAMSVLSKKAFKKRRSGTKGVI